VVTAVLGGSITRPARWEGARWRGSGGWSVGEWLTPMSGICLISAEALLSFSCRPAWWTYAGWALSGLLIPVAALTGWCAAVLLTSGDAGVRVVPAR
jgi:hypothetical protein